MLGVTEERVRFLDLADEVWDHLRQRRFGGVDLWDQPAEVFGVDSGMIPYTAPSWYHTERVMEALVVAADLAEKPPIAAEGITELALDLVAEPEHVFNQELMLGTAETAAVVRDTFATIQANLRRSRDLIARRPATAITLAQDVLRQLDGLAAARAATSRFL